MLPVYDKPMIYYPLSVLMLAGIREILIITTPLDQPRFKDLLGNGDMFGIHLEYAVQPEPKGLADAFLIGEDFLDGQPVALVLGDNLFFGHDFAALLRSSRLKIETDGGGVVFGYWVRTPSDYGVVEFDEKGKAISIIEKPKNPKSNFAVVGLYFYDSQVVDIAKSVEPSGRGELEITSINQKYLEKNELDVKTMGRGFAWLDMGTHDDLLEASSFIKTIETRQGLKMACLEEIAFNNKWITRETLLIQAKNLSKNQYGDYLRRVAGVNA